MPLFMFQQIIDGVDIGVGRLLDQVLGLGGGVGGWVGQPTSSPSYHHQGMLASMALVSSPNAAGSKRQGQFSCSYTLRSCSPTLTPSEAVSSSCLNEL